MDLMGVFCKGKLKRVKKNKTNKGTQCSPVCPYRNKKKFKFTIDRYVARVILLIGTLTSPFFFDFPYFDGPSSGWLLKTAFRFQSIFPFSISIYIFLFAKLYAPPV